MALKKFILKWMHIPIFWAIMVAALYALVTGFITIHLLHDSYHTSAFDLGVFTQELKYTLHGQILYSPAIGGSQFAPHFSPVLLLLVPVYWLFPHAQTLLVVQALLLAFGGYLIYVIAREYHYSHRASLMLEGLYFLNPLVWGVALFDFHEVAFAIPALLAMFLGLKRKNWIFFSLGLIFALASKEDAVWALAAFGVVLMISDFWQHKKVNKTSVIIFCSAIVTYGISIIVSRLASGGASARMLSYFTNRYAYIGLPLSEAIPMVLRTIFSNGSWFLISAYLVPLAFLPLLSPKWSIPALLILLAGILSTNANQHVMLLQYPAVAIPFLFMAFIEVLPGVLKNREIQSIITKTHNRATTYSIIVIVLISIMFIAGGRIQNISWPNKHDAAINQVIAAIPDNATVSASNEIFPHLCSRTDTYLFAWDGARIAPGSGITKSDWGFPDKETEYFIIDVKKTPWLEAYNKIVANKYEVIMNVDGVLLYQLKP